MILWKRGDFGQVLTKLWVNSVVWVEGTADDLAFIGMNHQFLGALMT